MKHVIGQFVEIAVGAEVVVRFNAKRYRGMVADLLDWDSPKKKPTKEKKNERKKKKLAKVSSAYVRMYAYVRYVTWITYVDLYNSSILHSGRLQTAAQSTVDHPYKSMRICTDHFHSHEDSFIRTTTHSHVSDVRVVWLSIFNQYCTYVSLTVYCILSAWLKTCRASVGQVTGETLVRLLENLMELILLYIVEVWGDGNS